MLTWLLALALAAPQAPLADAVALGDCTRVLAERPPDDLARRTPAAERLAVAWCLRDRPAAEVAPVVDGLEEEPFRSWGRLVLGEALAREGSADALPVLHALDLPGPGGRHARLLEGRTLVALGRSLEARPLLRDLLDGPEGDEARYLLAVGGRDRGDRAAAIATFQRVWIDSTRGPWGERAAAALEALGAPVPDLTSSEGRALVQRRVEALQAARQHGEALTWIDRLRAAEGRTAPSADYGRALFRGRKYAEAADVWSRVIGDEPGSRAAADLLFDLALAISRTGDYARAAERYTQLVTLHPRHREADEASYKLGYLPYDQGRCEDAVTAWTGHLERYPGSRFASSALWFSGWCRLTRGRTDEALATWGRLIAEQAGDELVPAARYWTARVAGQRGDVAGETRDLQALLGDHPDTGHAWLAAQRLGTRFPLRRVAPRPPWPEAWRQVPAVRHADALLEAGFRSWAGDTLRTLVPDARSREERLALAHALILAGDGKTARRLAAPWCDADPDEDPVGVQACHPRPEASLVTATATARGLHPLLPYAIMWSESLFDPDVTSGAGARGLMQLMPAELERVHASAGLAFPADPDALWRAPYNAVLGTTELADLQGRLAPLLDGSPLPAAIAAYNGGEAAVRRWVERIGLPPVQTDRFVEEVGYPETRRYVRRVLGHLMAYQRVYGVAR
ncbi:MAG: tetratricopeptide repeat protein [Alphaproteobacteria bacterium]|nr:tetratricopeptide repeat protein [Alphaproteobacteria bacterium]